MLFNANKVSLRALSAESIEQVRFEVSTWGAVLMVCFLVIEILKQAHQSFGCASGSY